jgi:hypothetical protein
MKKRTVYLLSAVVAALVILPVVAYVTFRTHSQLDRFLHQRLVLLEKLDANVKDLPPGFEHFLPPVASAIHPGNDHIRSVVRNGQLWFGDNYSSYDLSIVGPLRDASPREVVTGLFRHLTSGMVDLGFVSPKSGGPDWIVENRRAAHSTWWHNSDRSLLVTISVVVDTDSDSVHVTRYVHERFP